MNHILDKEKHERILADFEHVCRTAGIQNKFLRESMTGYCGPEELYSSQVAEVLRSCEGYSGNGDRTRGPNPCLLLTNRTGTTNKFLQSIAQLAVITVEKPTEVGIPTRSLSEK